jgi:hypothetical protein
MSTPTDPVETLCALDLGGRGIGRLLVPGAMAAAARSLATARRVVFVTGFVARPGWGAETDGPSGTAVLGRALRRLGATVRYVADPPVVPLLQACLRALRAPRDLVVVSGDPRAAGEAAQAAVRTFAPTHLVAIERPGRAADGDDYNARGGSVAAQHAPLDTLFVRRRNGVETVGVGDGGKEIGMGRVRARVARDVPNGARIAPVVRTDHLVVAGTSNWGAWGLTAHLGLAGGRDRLHTPDEEARLDSLPLALHRTFLSTLRELAGHLRARRRAEPAAVIRGKETA